MVQRSQIIPLQGGLDLVSPAMLVEPGKAIAGVNYETEARGYRRCEGFERYDGQPKPSLASYWILFFDVGSVEITAGDTVTGLTSGATAIAIENATLDSGTYGGGDAAGWLALYNLSGTFQDDEFLQVSAASVARANGVATEGSATTDAAHLAYIATVRATRRALIAAPTGSGAIRGIATLGGSVYCWRDNAGGTAGQMWKASTAGWVLQSFGTYLYFDAGTTIFTEGETLTGGTSTATATIERVVLTSGAWDGTAVGYLVLSGEASGPFQNNEAITSAGGAAVANGASVAITLPAAGRYRSVSANFYSQANTERLYVANGVGPAFEWDGTVLAPVFTGLTAALEKPLYVANHRSHLFLAYEGGSIQNSATGLPLAFNADGGALEFGFAQTITGLKSDTRDSLIVTGRNKVGYLTGSIPAEFDLKSVSEDSGAFSDSLEVVGVPIFLDDQGVRDMQASQAYGDWMIGTMTRPVAPLMASKIKAGVGVVGALRVRSKDQYRLFWDNGTGIYIYFGRENPEIMPFLLDVVPSCLLSGEDALGNEVLFMGGADGMVYELDAGVSFDGNAIAAFFRTGWLNQSEPNTFKRYHRARIEGTPSELNTVLAVTADFTYGSDEQPPADGGSVTFQGAGGFWDEAVWDEFNWDAKAEGQELAAVEGIGESVSIVLASNTATETPHTLSTLTVNFSKRRKVR